VKSFGGLLQKSEEKKPMQEVGGCLLLPFELLRNVQNGLTEYLNNPFYSLSPTVRWELTLHIDTIIYRAN
jgi:hypothetical protein